MTTTTLYPTPVLAIAELLDFFDNEEFINQMDDAGLAFESLSLTTSDGEEYVGWIEFDPDHHPYFCPAN